MPALKHPFRSSPRHSARLMQLSFPVLACLLATACATTSTGLAPAKELACDTYGVGTTYDSTRDTAQTVREVQTHNQAFENIGCNLDQGTVAK